MAIVARTSVNSAAMTAAWAKGVQGGAAKWLAGIKSPRVLPNANPATATANWLAGVSTAAPEYSAGLSSPSYLPALEAGATAKQGSYSGSAVTGLANETAASAKVAAMLNTVMASLPPKGPKGTNTARSTAQQTGMHALKGQGKAR